MFSPPYVESIKCKLFDVPLADEDINVVESEVAFDVVLAISWSVVSGFAFSVNSYWLYFKNEKIIHMKNYLLIGK